MELRWLGVAHQKRCSSFNKHCQPRLLTTRNVYHALRLYKKDKFSHMLHVHVFRQPHLWLPAKATILDCYICTEQLNSLSKMSALTPRSYRTLQARIIVSASFS